MGWLLRLLLFLLLIVVILQVLVRIFNGFLEGLGARQRRTHQRPTHEVQSVRGRKLIVRRRFTCGPACWTC